MLDHVKHYLQYFHHFDQFFKDDHFFKALQKIRSYENPKLQCFKMFLEKTGASFHEIFLTTEAFDHFWKTLEELCYVHHADIQDIVDKRWTTPEGGHPAVYMERLLYILENAGDLNLQMRYLDGLCLNQYGAYYASKYEGFKLVSKEMGFDYQPKLNRNEAFNPEASLYRIDMETLRHRSQDNSFDNESIFKMVCRFLGQHKQCINLAALQRGFENLKEKEPEAQLSSIIFTSLFFLVNSPYQDEADFERLFTSLQNMQKDSFIRDYCDQQFLKLYQRGMTFNVADGVILCELISQLGSEEFNADYSQEDKVNYIDKLFHHLKTNTASLFNGLSKLAENSDSPLSLIHMLDFVDFMANDYCIKTTYAQQILMFAGVVSKDLLKTPHQERIKAYLIKAATNDQPNNLDYAFKLLIRSKDMISVEKILMIFEAVDEYPVAHLQTVEALVKDTHGISLNTFVTTYIESARDPSNFKMVLIELLNVVVQLKEEKSLEDIFSSSDDVLAKKEWIETKEALEINDIIQEIENTLPLLNDLSEDVIKQLLNPAKEAVIKLALAELKTNEISDHFKNEISGLNCLRDVRSCHNFNQMRQISNCVEGLVARISQILEMLHLQPSKEALNKAFQSINCSNFSAAELFMLLGLIQQMPNRDYAKILEALASNKEKLDELLFEKLIEAVARLHTYKISSKDIAKLIELFLENPAADFHDFLDAFAPVVQDHDFTQFITNANNVPLVLLQKTLRYALHFDDSRMRIELARLFKALSKTPHHLESFIEQLEASGEHAFDILEIIARCHSRVDKNADPLIIQNLVGKLRQNPKYLPDIFKLCKTTPPRVIALDERLDELMETNDFLQFLDSLEKHPFGPRNLQEQFSVTEVERVINNSQDLRNQSIYSFEYRMKLMRYFLFVNKLGYSLPLFYGKSAKDLSNQELRAYFLDLKIGEPSHLSDFERRLLALALMREAMYRTTGKFPWSTQMIALVDCIMHSGNFISGIDTGQGKSIIDAMKAALLWLSSDRVDVTTSSLTDAKRDIGICQDFWELLGISYSAQPITSKSPLENYALDGINYSTASQLALFHAQHLIEGENVSAVFNETDYSLLDDRTIYRFACSDKSKPNFGEEWIYYAINEFIELPSFIKCDTSQEEDIHALRVYLQEKAKQNNVAPGRIKKFDDDQLLTWIESALFVRYILKENVHYVIPEEPINKCINGKIRLTKKIKIIMTNWKCSEDTCYGKGITPLLYARENTLAGAELFVIEPETKTVIASNNKNLVDYYHFKNGFIWGSTATPGSRGEDGELAEQYRKYGLDFSKIEPHQNRNLQIQAEQILANEQEQFDALKQQLLQEELPALVFMKDIETAKRCFDYLSNEQIADKPIQFYAGQGDEERVVQQAAKENTITVTTPALGRNIDVRYDREQGMAVYLTSIDTERDEEQKIGRTGREGSPGIVYTFLNREDLNEQESSEIRRAFYEKALRERQYNEELYDLLYFLLNQILTLNEDDFVEDTKINFLKTQWAQFNEESERLYHEQHLNQSYSKDDFISERRAAFIRLLEGTVQEKVVSNLDGNAWMLSFEHSKQTSYPVYHREVKMTDCLPVELLAFRFVKPYSQLDVVDDDLDEVDALDQTLAQLIISMERGYQSRSAETLVNQNEEYIQFICRHLHLADTIKTKQGKALKEHIDGALLQASQRSFWQKRFKKQTRLGQQCANKNYLAVLHTMAIVQGESPLEFKQLQGMVKNLFTDYLTTSWFVSTKRKRSIEKLFEAFDAAEDMTQLTHLLINERLRVMVDDIDENRSGWKRKIKPINRSGSSRFQKTVDKALTLLATLDEAPLGEEMIQGLTEALERAAEPDSSVDFKPDLDSFNAVIQSMTTPRDKGNTKVITKSLKKTLRWRSKLSIEEPQGMVARFGLFTEKQEEIKNISISLPSSDSENDDLELHL